MKKLLAENKYLLTLWVICILGLLFFLGHYIDIIIDFGREVYYPEQILKGKVLYKDLFNIYGPLSYQFNALLYKIFGAKLSTLYVSGAICSLLTVNGIFLIAKKYLSEFLSFCVGIITIVTGITTPAIFNFHFPYSWAILYGLVAFIYSLLFLIKFEESKNTKFLCISSVLAGICITCKYEFLLYALFILLLTIKNKSLKALLLFFIVPVISYGTLFVQGMSITDLTDTLNVVSSMAQTKTLTYFYQNCGIYFHIKYLYTNILYFISFAIPFGTMLHGAGLYKKKKPLAVFIIILSAIMTFVWAKLRYVYAFTFLPMLLVLTGIYYYKNTDNKLQLLLISSLTLSAKVFWAILLKSYGTFYFPILLVAFLALIFFKLPKKYEKFAGIFLLIFSIMYFKSDMKIYKSTQQKIVTEKGIITTKTPQGESSAALIEYINKNTNPQDKIVIFPEGMMINFLTNRKSDDYYNSLIPLYVETFGQDKIIEHFKEFKPDYIIFNNKNTKEYYYSYICQDYGLDFCAFVQDNYEYQETIGDDFRYLIFKLINL